MQGGGEVNKYAASTAILAVEITTSIANTDAVVCQNLEGHHLCVAIASIHLLHF
jgi:hypothetical protein